MVRISSEIDPSPPFEALSSLYFPGHQGKRGLETRSPETASTASQSLIFGLSPHRQSQVLKKPENAPPIGGRSLLLDARARVSAHKGRFLPLYL